MQIAKKQIGVIELEHDLDIEVVTDIFIRINSQGVMLSQADFAMSKIAANEVYGGSTLRKCIDYFCHLAVAPEFYAHISEVDKDFTKTKYFPKISWLKTETDDLWRLRKQRLSGSECINSIISRYIMLSGGRKIAVKVIKSDTAIA